MASPTHSLKNTVRKTSIARRISPQTQDLPFFDEIVNLIQQAKKVFDAISREENNTNTGLMFAKDLYDEKVDITRDNYTISLDGAFRAIGTLIFNNRNEYSRNDLPIKHSKRRRCREINRRI